MHNPFLLHSQQLRQRWKDLRSSFDGETDLIAQLQTVSDFWNQAPTSKPYLDYLDPSNWPDAWSLLDNKILDKNSLSLGMFYTLMLCGQRSIDPARLRLSMVRQSSLAWEGLVCVVDDRWAIGYDANRVIDIQSIPDLFIMHTYKYDLRKRSIAEIELSIVHSHQV